MALAAERSGESAAPVSPESVMRARRGVVRKLGTAMTTEQREALEIVTGPGGVSVLVGQAGTGKGVVLGAAAESWRREGYTVWGTAIAGATAQRLGADAKLDQSLTTDALLQRVESGRVSLDERSVVVIDEAGMADTRRLSGLIDRTNEAGAKLVLAGDSAQLGSIGAGGLFEAIRHQVPAAELSQIHRARNEWERQAWGQVRAGGAERALAAYQERERLHVSDSRVEAAQRMVADWDRSRTEVGDGRSVMLTDASNREIDEINALAQQARRARGELGRDGIELRDRGYALFEGDRVTFAAAMHQPGEARVENGTPGFISEVRPEEGLRVRTEEPEPREVAMGARDALHLRLGYAQHVYKAQGVTAERAHVLIGGWQTDRERAYVALTRARERTDVYVSRDDLGEEGMDEGAIDRLAERMAESRAQEASITHKEAYAGHSTDRESEAGRTLREQRDHERGWPQSGNEQPDERDTPRSEAGRILEEERAREAERGFGIE